MTNPLFHYDEVGVLVRAHPTLTYPLLTALACSDDERAQVRRAQLRLLPPASFVASTPWVNHHPYYRAWSSFEVYFELYQAGWSEDVLWKMSPSALTDARERTSRGDCWWDEPYVTPPTASPALVYFQLYVARNLPVLVGHVPPEHRAELDAHCVCQDGRYMSRACWAVVQRLAGIPYVEAWSAPSEGGVCVNTATLESAAGAVALWGHPRMYERVQGLNALCRRRCSQSRVDPAPLRGAVEVVAVRGWRRLLRGVIRGKGNFELVVLSMLSCAVRDDLKREIPYQMLLVDGRVRRLVSIADHHVVQRKRKPVYSLHQHRYSDYTRHVTWKDGTSTVHRGETWRDATCLFRRFHGGPCPTIFCLDIHDQCTPAHLFALAARANHVYLITPAPANRVPPEIRYAPG